MAKKKSRKKRGYPVAILIGFDQRKAALWEVFSKQIRPLKSLTLTKKGSQIAENELYNFFEQIVDALRSHIKEGLRSIILVNPKNSPYSENFQDHLQKHHKWLTQQNSSNYLTIGILEGQAITIDDVTDLAETTEFKEIISDTTAEEAHNIVLELEERLNKMTRGDVVLYSLQEIEELTYGKWRYGSRQPEYVILTDKYLNRHRQKGRVHRLLQILKNKEVKTRIIEADSPAGERITQFGGIVCFTTTVEQ